ncbi:MAG: hypothetical protein DRQ47_10860 [Gammaproteobacteria bacterium]|nr:MAG: hypothetical protein DRQ47_10860 [Gammaproteobacteria bacterium]
MSTFSKLRVGKKPYLAGTPKMNLMVDTTALGVVGSLPAGAIILSAFSDAGVAEVTVGTATLTTAAINTSVASDVLVAQVADAEVEVTTAIAGNMNIEYLLPLDGANG